MVVQHNLTAMNSNRMLGITQGAQAKVSEKLSSGYRINRAADDAAGLSISEKMRKQINGLDQASTNAQDGVSAVQTAEGALTEVHSMLQRMNELAVQAANGTNSESDRDAIQAEIEQLTTEIDRVAETTKFNETYLLKGNADGASSVQNVAAHDAGLAGKLVDNGDGTTSFALNKKLENGDKVTIAGKEYTIGTAKNPQSYMDMAKLDDVVLKVGDSVTVNGETKTVTDDISMAQLAAYKDKKGAAKGNQEFATGNTITTADGSVYTFTDGGTAAIPNSTATSEWTNADGEGLTASQIESLMNTEGNVFTNSTGAHKIVAALEVGEVSTAFAENLKAGTVASTSGKNDDAVTAAAGKFSIEKDGKTIEAVATAFAADTYGNIKDGIMASQAGKTVTISDIKGENKQVYEIVENSEDEDLSTDGLAADTAKKLTRENIIALLKEGDQVTYFDNNKAGGAGDVTKTVAGAETLAEDAITVSQAYGMMAEELQKASSIGTDTAAKVTNNGDGTFDIKQGSVEVKDSLNFNLHVGADADMTNKITVDIDAMSAAGLGIKGINVSDNTGANATYAIDAIADAVAKVSAQRSALGAVQNRLEHTIANLDNVVENTTAAESRIRDTDMAETMVEFSKNNILAQAGQSMLAQANQSTQGVLSLLG